MPNYINPKLNAPVISIGLGEGAVEGNANGTGTITIPKTAGGVQPKFIYVSWSAGTDTNRVSIAPGGTAPADETGFVLTVKNCAAVILNVHGYTELSWAETGAGNSNLAVYPLSDF